jgi:hypothetical protein
MLSALLLTQLPCPGERCSPRPESVTWQACSDEPNRSYLFVNGRQLGGYDADRDEWRTFDLDAGTWGPPQALFPHRTGRLIGVDGPNFGVMRERLGGEERYLLSGRPVHAAAAREAVGGLEDDSALLHLTVIGPPAERQAVLDDLEHHAALAPLRRQLLVQGYDPDHWAVAGAGFVRTGHPTIYLQAPDGQVLHRQDEYRGPDKLAEAIRRANPNYHPEQDPDLNASSIWSRLSRLPRWTWVAIVVLSLYLISKRRSKS